MTSSSEVALFARIRALPCFRAAGTPEPLPGGLSNHNYTVRDETGTYVVRHVLGDVIEHGIVRRAEIAASEAAFRAGLSPELVHAEPDLIVIRMIEGRTLTADDIRDPARIQPIAALLRRVHHDTAPHLRGPAPFFWVFHVVRDYLLTLEAHGRMLGELAALRRVNERLETAAGSTRIVFTHSDLVPANLIEDERRLWLIDWEFAGYGSALFDLAGLAMNASFDQAQKMALLTAYAGRAPGRDVARRFSAIFVAACLRESLWGRVQEIYGKLPIDYTAYAETNWVRFEAAHAAFLRGDYP